MEEHGTTLGIGIINVNVVYCNMQMSFLSPKSVFIPRRVMLQLSKLLARRCNVEARICLNQGLKRGEVSDEESGGDTRGIGGPHEGSEGLWMCWTKGD